MTSKPRTNWSLFFCLFLFLFCVQRDLDPIVFYSTVDLIILSWTVAYEPFKTILSWQRRLNVPPKWALWVYWPIWNFDKSNLKSNFLVQTTLDQVWNIICKLNLNPPLGRSSLSLQMKHIQWIMSSLILQLFSMKKLIIRYIYIYIYKNCNSYIKVVCN